MVCFDLGTRLTPVDSIQANLEDEHTSDRSCVHFLVSTYVDISLEEAQKCSRFRYLTHQSVPFWNAEDSEAWIFA
jgi:hypothetical protein